MKNYIPIKFRLSFFCLFIFIIFGFINLAAQVPEIEWQKSYGTSGWDQAKSIIQTSDSGYIVAGGRGGYDGDAIGCEEYGGYWILKLNQSGEIEWTNCYGGTGGNEEVRSVKETADGGYIIGGYSYSSDGDVTVNHGNADCWIVKISISGEIEWQQTYGGTSYECAESITQTTDGGYIFGATSHSDDGDISNHHGGTDNSDYWVVKTDYSGNIEWEKSFGGTEDEDVFSIYETINGKILIAGSSQSNNGDVSGNHGENDFWILKLDEIGNILWQKSYGGSNSEQAYSIIETLDKKIVVAGYTESEDFDVSGNHGSNDFWLIKIDSSSNLIWQKCFGGSNWDGAYSLMETIDLGFIINGYACSNNGDVSGHHGGSSYPDCWIIKTDSLGDIHWQQSYGGTNEDQALSIINTFENSFVFAGFSRSNDGDLTSNHGDFDYWIVKLSFCNTHYYADTDADGFGNLLIDSIACNLPIGFVLDSTDCNDANNLIHPSAEDICNSIDDNCNGEIDEDALFVIQYADADGDEFGNIVNDSVSCFELLGFVLDSTDCNDTNAFINPASSEICNAIDDNCNTDIDEGLTIYTFYADTDADGFGNSDVVIFSCMEIIEGYVSDSTDCDDTNNLIYPEAEEICNYLDDDCDGIVDDNLAYIHSYQDADGDNFGNIEIDSLACIIPFGYVVDDSDCDDTNSDIYPGATEILNGVDDDCNGSTDEGLAINEIILSSIHIYPNPTDDILHIDYFGNEEIYIEVVNITGQILFSNKIISPSNEINISTFAPGMYVLRIYADEKAAAVTFEKQ